MAMAIYALKIWTFREHWNSSSQNKKRKAFVIFVYSLSSCTPGLGSASTSSIMRSKIWSSATEGHWLKGTRWLCDIHWPRILLHHWPFISVPRVRRWQWDNDNECKSVKATVQFHGSYKRHCGTLSDAHGGIQKAFNKWFRAKTIPPVSGSGV